jgi:hypothetical protein
MRQKPAYDDLIQGATALPALMAQTADGVPRYVPNALGRPHRRAHGGGRDLRQPGRSRIAPAAASASISRCSRPWPAFVMGDHMGGLTYEPPLDKGGYARICRPTGGPTRPRTAISA